MAQLLDALTVLKEQRLIHCDLKPENILLKSCVVFPALLTKQRLMIIDYNPLKSKSLILGQRAMNSKLCTPISNLDSTAPQKFCLGCRIARKFCPALFLVSPF